MQRLAAVARWADANVTNPDARKIGSVDHDLDKERLANAAKKAGILRCKLLDNGMALQSYADAMKVVCNAPTSDLPAYFKGHLLNPEVIRLFATLEDYNPADRVQRISDAIARAGITSCASLPKFARSALTVPTVQDGGLVDVEPLAPMVIATTQSISIDGKAIIALENGAIAPDELEGGAQGIMIPRVREFLRALAAQLPPAAQMPALELALDPSLTGRVLFDLAFSSARGGFTRLGLVVHAGAGNKAIPIELPQKRPATTQPGPAPLGMALAFSKDKLLVWSISGQEGTLQKPKATVATAGELAPVLGEIVARRWKTTPRSEDDRSIIVMIDPAVPMQRIAEVLAAVRAMPDGKELFPSILLSSGFE
jgi:hypothetical protein